MNEKEALNAQIKGLMKKYKYTMWALVVCIAFYLLFLFGIKAAWTNYAVLAICVVMIVLAIFNIRYSKAIQKLAKEKQELDKQEKLANGELNEADLQTADEAVAANAASLNDLPKAYTVLDEVKLNDGTAQHVIVSPYGVAIVGSEDLKPAIEEILVEKGIEAPVFVYEPIEDVAELAQAIQMEKQTVLDESQIMAVLYRLTGIKN